MPGDRAFEDVGTGGGGQGLVVDITVARRKGRQRGHLNDFGSCRAQGLAFAIFALNLNGGKLMWFDNAEFNAGVFLVDVSADSVYVKGMGNRSCLVWR